MSDIQEEQKRLYKRAEENDRKDTISIQDLFDERNKNNQRISELVLQREELQDRINKAIEYIEKYESIKAYYEYIDEDDYDEYNYDEDFKKEIIDILKGDKYE